MSKIVKVCMFTFFLLLPLDNVASATVDIWPLANLGQSLINSDRPFNVLSTELEKKDEAQDEERNIIYRIGSRAFEYLDIREDARQGRFPGWPKIIVGFSFIFANLLLLWKILMRKK